MRKNKMIKNEPATINLHVRDDSDFLSPYAEEGKPIISTEIADFLEKTIRAYHQSAQLFSIFIPLVLMTMKKYNIKKQFVIISL